MKNFFILAACCFSTLFAGDNSATIFSKDRLVEFYDLFLLEEKELLADAGLSKNTTQPTNPFVPPPNPPPPAFKNGLLPFVIVNNSGLPDSQVYVLVTGDLVSNTAIQTWGNINTSPGPNFGVATMQPVSNSDNSETFSVALSALPVGSTGRVIYLPPIASGLIWFSMSSPLNMPVSGGKITQPGYSNPTDPNYNINYDIFEVAYIPGGSPAVSVDATAVSFFSIPLYGYLAGATSTSSNTGLYQPRSYIMAHAASVLSSGVESSQWNKLLLKNGNTVLRLLATGKSMSIPEFDSNYLDNAASYGYSYIGSVWDAMGSYYKTNTLKLSVTTTAPAGIFAYNGNVQPDNTFTFTPTNGGPAVTPFPAPSLPSDTTPTSTTSYAIFSGLNFYPTQPTAGTPEDAIGKLIQEAIIAGLFPLPAANVLSLPNLLANQSNYYTVNSFLSSTGQSTGPWFDLYSKALHSLGSIYAFAYDDAMWPQVLLGGPFNNNSTYIGITIGSVE